MKTYSITGRKWEKKPYMLRNAKMYHPLETKEFECEANSLDEALIWMLENEPEWAIGCSIKQGSDFLITVAKGFHPIEQDTEDESEMIKARLEEAKRWLEEAKKRGEI